MNLAPGALLPRTVALVLGAYAISALLRLPPLADSAVSRPKTNPEDRGWSVKVDGWQIEVDEVLAGEDDRQGYGKVEESFSSYDRLVAKYSRQAGLDWRLVSALIFEESRFQPHVESAAGAYGLMQVRSIAAEQMGEPEYRDPEDNIRTGTRYLAYLLTLFGGAAERDCLALALAAYNMGPSHVWDAQALAREFGLDPHRWDGSVAVTTALLEQPAVCQRVKSGCAFGEAAAAYVERVLARFATYRRFRSDMPAGWPFSVVIGGQVAAQASAAQASDAGAKF